MEEGAVDVGRLLPALVPLSAFDEEVRARTRREAAVWARRN
jgi:hypothetical protein